MSDELAVWLYGERVATIDRQRGRLGLRYTEAALSRYDLGSPLLSVSLPVSGTRFTQGLTKPFLEGLLPEGEPRRTIARRLGIRQNDTFGLIEELGRDCAGAVVIQPADSPAPQPATTATAETLDAAGLEEMVRTLQSAPLGSGGRVRVSLAGVQEKLLLTRMPDGAWGLPVDGTPSTHILKPEIAAYPYTVENEAFCMRTAKHLGLGVAQVDTAEIAGRKVLIVERFDREVGADGTTTRIHQEDLCQAVGVVPDEKYEDDGAPHSRGSPRGAGGSGPWIARTAAPSDHRERDPREWRRARQEHLPAAQHETERSRWRPCTTACAPSITAMTGWRCTSTTSTERTA